MSAVYFNSDLHLGHDSVLEFADGYRSKCMDVETINEHDEKIFDLWNDKITKRDKIFILGDLGYNVERMKKLPGTKILHLGNHDHLKASEYLDIFDDIIGPLKHHRKFWITHFPIHESEFWNVPKNVHGHTHSNGVEDERYVNVSVEMTGGYPINAQDIISGKFHTYKRVNKLYQPFEAGTMAFQNPK